MGLAGVFAPILWHVTDEGFLGFGPIAEASAINANVASTTTLGAHFVVGTALD